MTDPAAPFDCASCAGGRVYPKTSVKDGIRTDVYVCDACGCGLKWRRRVVSARPRAKVAPIPPFDRTVIDAAGGLDLARHHLLDAARAAETAGVIGVIEGIQNDLVALTRRVADLLTDPAP